MPPDLAEPWRGFLAELDRLVNHDVRLHCCGGFVVTMLYGLVRTTADLDVFSIFPIEDQRSLATVAGPGDMVLPTLNNTPVRAHQASAFCDLNARRIYREYEARDVTTGSSS